MSWGIRLAALVAGLALGAPASAAAFDAHGSVNQVYVTGLSPGAKTTLLDRRGRRVKTQRANPLGGLLFRDVRPGSRYRVRGRRTLRAAHRPLRAARPAEHGLLRPADPLQRLRLPDHARRHQARLRRPPAAG